ncbi:MAG TPA: sigma-54 factor interaction domain-containing protein, partial [Rhodocyclaceae bacterium]|nr:sigma-54 factor interaction domain-containing protein [Rhodocyclaceae bacterium]
DCESGETFYVETLSVVRHASTRPAAQGLVGRAPAFRRMLDRLLRAAPAMANVLLLGETGTGKEVAARALHEASGRAAGPFVPVDCSGLSETLFESELFGHEKGAFTGASHRKTGLVEAAAGGTLFLDEVGDIPAPMQVKLLRLLETGTYRRVGGVDVPSRDSPLPSSVTATSPGWCGGASSAGTCTTASTPFRCMCRPWRNDAPTSPCSPSRCSRG